MKIGYIQNDPFFGEKEKNLASVEEILKGVRADLIVLPELFATGYTFTSIDEVAGLSEDVEDTTSRFLCNKSIVTGATIVAGFIEREGADFYNSSLIISSGKIIGTYRKLHLFYKEKQFFTPGNRPLDVYTVNGLKIGVMICFDWIFPEVTRVLAIKGAQVIAHPANLVMPWCQQAMQTRCIENRVFAGTANRIGTEKRGDDDNTFTCRSQIVSPVGEILLAAPADSQATGFIDIDPALADNKMINPFNDLVKDRRTEFYI
jgi:predicted amidohydrolase